MTLSFSPMGVSSPALAATVEQRPAVVVVASQLARCESELSDWVNCASGKTPAGRAYIQEISAQIAKPKAQIKQAEEPWATPSPVPKEVAAAAAQQSQSLRFDSLGSWVNLQA
jgi:hypothetical protein